MIYKIVLHSLIIIDDKRGLESFLYEYKYLSLLSNLK